MMQGKVVIILNNVFIDEHERETTILDMLGSNDLFICEVLEHFVLHHWRLLFRV